VLRVDLTFTVKRRVLVIEDDPDGRRLIVDALVERGIDVIAAVDGLHALRTALAVSPSVVVLDLALPEMDGARFIEQWRDRYPQARGVPVVVVSGKSDAREIATRIGASRVFKKPFIVEDLVSEVSRVLH
jgi:DNA-binding response OmpR family regulator